MVTDKGYRFLFGENIEDNSDVFKLTRLIEHWPTFADLKIIVVGSSTIPDFESSGAFVGQLRPDKKPCKSVEQLIKAINFAYYQEEDQEKDDKSYYLQSLHSKFDHGILFINVCLDDKQDKLETVKLTIGFINTILKSKQDANKQITVLDMRLDKHRHESESDGYSDKFSDLRKYDTQFIIEQRGDLHTILRLHHPGYVDDNFIQGYLGQITALPIEISSIYRDRQSCKF